MRHISLDDALKLLKDLLRVVLLGSSIFVDFGLDLALQMIKSAGASYGALQLLERSMGLKGA